MAKTLTIVGLGGSMASVSKSRAALQRALEGAEGAGAETQLLDIRQLDLPIFNPEDDEPTESAARLIESSAYDDAYQRMRRVDEPWPLGDPNEVAQAVVRAIEDETTGLRVVLGDDAAWYLRAKSQGDDDYRRRIWQLWKLGD